jgi:hypothetical protein
MPCGTGGEQLFGLSAANLVREFDEARIGGEDLRLDEDLLIVTSWIKIPARNIYDGQIQPFPSLQIFVVKSSGAHKFHSSDFHPDEIVRVIYDAHLVRFRVTNAQARLVLPDGRFDLPQLDNLRI